MGVIAKLQAKSKAAKAKAAEARDNYNMLQGLARGYDEAVKDILNAEASAEAAKAKKKTKRKARKK